jgi:uncharacterized LabA/DUF88 family protein
MEMELNMLNEASIFIDGGHYSAIQKYHNITFDFNLFVSQVKRKLTEHLGIEVSFPHIFYYDCMPFQYNESAMTRKSSYFKFLNSCPGVSVREGTVVRRTSPEGQSYYQQKKVDLLLGLDVAAECRKGSMKYLVLVTGDGDYCPVVTFASGCGVKTWLFFGGFQSVSTELWSLADVRINIDEEFASKVRREN